MKKYLAVAIILQLISTSANASCFNAYHEKIESKFKAWEQKIGSEHVGNMGLAIGLSSLPMSCMLAATAAAGKSIENYERVFVLLGGTADHILPIQGKGADLSYERVIEKVLQQLSNKRIPAELKDNPEELRNKVEQLIAKGDQQNDFCKNQLVMKYSKFIKYLAEGLADGS